MNKILRRRIADLQSHVVIGCETCRDFTGFVLIDDESRTSQPECCPDCGRVVPFRRVLHIVGIPLDLP